MAWVKSEYAGPLAVLSTWLVALLPWSVTGFTRGELTLTAIRFPFFRVQYVFGVGLGDQNPFLWTWEIPDFQVAPELTTAGEIAIVGAAVYALALGFSVAYYVAEDRVESLPIDPVRTLAAGIGLASVLFLASTALFVRHHAGVTLPVGSVVALALAYVLLTVDRT